MASAENDWQLWERQDGEPAKAFAAFIWYRDLGPETRSLNLAYQRESGAPPAMRAPGTWAAWSSEWRWVERAAAYDAYLDDLRRRVREAKLRELEERRAEFELAHQARLEERVDKIDKLLDQLDPAEAAIKGSLLSGAARLLKEQRETARQAIEGVRTEPDDPKEKDGAAAVVKAGEFAWVKPIVEEEPSGE